MRIEYDDTEAGVALSNHLHLKVVDDDTPTAEQLHIGVAFVQDQIEKNGSVYIHCGSGIGRAPTMAAAYLLSTGLTTEQAWALIRKTRPFIRPTPVQVEQIEQFAALSKSEERLSAAATLESED
jgi:protein-tyrosine phosphatase